MPTFQETFDDLRWKKFPVLNDGFVCLVDVMGDDSSIVQAARVSYGAGTKKVSDDRTLIRYLMRHRHTSPLEMAEIKLLVRVPMDCWRQWIRHRTANVNEYSTRYSEAIDSCQTTLPDQWRLQAENNKQGSDGAVDLVDGKELSRSERALQERSRDVYQMRLSKGVAREQARKDLPLSTYTEAYWKCDLSNIFHFLSLRMDSHAQKEIRDYATIIGEQIVAPLYPLAWNAFCDYRLNAMTLSALEIAVLRAFSISSSDMLEEKWAYAFDAGAEWKMNGKNRERDEFVAKLPRLGFVWDGRWIKQEA